MCTSESDAFDRVFNQKDEEDALALAAEDTTIEFAPINSNISALSPGMEMRFSDHNFVASSFVLICPCRQELLRVEPADKDTRLSFHLILKATKMTLTCPKCGHISELEYKQNSFLSENKKEDNGRQ